MQTYTRAEIFELFYNNKIGQGNAIEKNAFKDYSDFKDAYFWASYASPVTREEE